MSYHVWSEHKCDRCGEVLRRPEADDSLPPCWGVVTTETTHKGKLSKMLCRECVERVYEFTEFLPAKKGNYYPADGSGPDTVVVPGNPVPPAPYSLPTTSTVWCRKKTGPRIGDICRKQAGHEGPHDPPQGIN